MEKRRKSLQQTTSTSFYNPSSSSKSPSNKQNSPPQTKLPLNFHPIKSTFPELILSIENLNDRSQFIVPYLLNLSLQSLEHQLSIIKKLLRKCQANIITISQFEQLKATIAKMSSLFKQTKQKYTVIVDETKNNIEYIITHLEKFLIWHKKQWEKLRKKCQVELSEGVEEIKGLKQMNQGLLLGLVKSTAAKLRQQTNQFTQELKISKKNFGMRNSILLNKLQSVRNNLNSLVVQQEQKRCQYDEIIYNLLDKTCQNAAKSLRRRVF